MTNILPAKPEVQGENMFQPDASPHAQPDAKPSTSTSQNEAKLNLTVNKNIHVQKQQ